MSFAHSSVSFILPTNSIKAPRESSCHHAARKLRKRINVNMKKNTLAFISPTTRHAATISLATRIWQSTNLLGIAGYVYTADALISLNFK
jgi:hypothetical protein